MLVLSVLAGSFIGPSSNMLQTEQTWLKTSWAHALRAIYCIPLVIVEVSCTKDYMARVRAGLTRRNILGTLFTPILYCYWNFGLIYGAANMI